MKRIKTIAMHLCVVCLASILTTPMLFAQSGDISGSTSNFTTLGTTILKLGVTLAGMGFVGLIIWGGLTLTTDRSRGLAMIGGGMVGALLAGLAFVIVNTSHRPNGADGRLVAARCAAVLPFLRLGGSMTSDEQKLEPINDTLNPEPSKFGMPWYVILGILSIAVLVFLLPGCKIFGALLCPSTLGFGWWLTKDDPQELQLMLHDLLLPSEFDPGK